MKGSSMIQGDAKAYSRRLARHERHFDISGDTQITDFPARWGRPRARVGLQTCCPGRDMSGDAESGGG